MANETNGNGFFPMFRDVPATGVIWVMGQARLAGYAQDNSDWCNFGQGAPETGPLPDAPERINQINIPHDDVHEYGPVAGVWEVREAVAALYNQRYRVGKMPYTGKNVALCAGGRVALSRFFAILGDVNVGHVLPDYTAYDEGMNAWGTFSPSPIIGGHQTHRFDGQRFRSEVLERGLSAFVLSNPNNPTGKVLSGPTLHDWVRQAADLECALGMDEFYSHYIFEGPQRTVSAAEYVDDVNRDPVVVIDGITKNWRYPGWRLAWTIAPEAVIERLANAGSFLDGGAPHPMQLAALPLLDRTHADAEARAIQVAFAEKRDAMVRGLRKLGLRLDAPKGSFYCWADTSPLPPGWNSGMGFFQKALAAKVICVPGQFFDINPGKRRPNRGPLKDWVRISFGPEMSKLQQGLAQLEEAMGR